mmetsp:Transcript_81390/g.186193  ORF Transcript_81390/g.186193 Transcript_81390/m.186193 type:complete len:87 (-) Transcript_81390:381-641(-)
MQITCRLDEGIGELLFVVKLLYSKLRKDAEPSRAFTPSPFNSDMQRLESSIEWNGLLPCFRRILTLPVKLPLSLPAKLILSAFTSV